MLACKVSKHGYTAETMPINLQPNKRHRPEYTINTIAVTCDRSMQKQTRSSCSQNPALYLIKISALRPSERAHGHVSICPRRQSMSDGAWLISYPQAFHKRTSMLEEFHLLPGQNPQQARKQHNTTSIDNFRSPTPPFLPRASQTTSTGFSLDNSQPQLAP